jgi:murein L,D-transpeptidase YafK
MRTTLLVFLTFFLAMTGAPTAKPLSHPVTAIVVEKAKRQLTLFNHRRAIKTYRVALGGSPLGHKEQEGDSKTPEGAYTIDAKNPYSSFHLSLHISYPNKSDRKLARKRGVSPGGAIMIHGTPEGLSLVNALGYYSDWTAGCIAVSNAEIEEIYASVKIGTPIFIKP